MQTFCLIKLTIKAIIKKVRLISVKVLTKVSRQNNVMAKIVSVIEKCLIKLSFNKTLKVNIWLICVSKVFFLSRRLNGKLTK